MARKPTRPRRAPAPPPPDARRPAAGVRAAIRAHVPDAIRELARLAREATSEQARVSAINALIDRGYGDLKHLAEADEGVAGITVRFVTAARQERLTRVLVRSSPRRRGPSAADVGRQAGDPRHPSSDATAFGRAPGAGSPPRGDERVTTHALYPRGPP